MSARRRAQRGDNYRRRCCSRMSSHEAADGRDDPCASGCCRAIRRSAGRSSGISSTPEERGGDRARARAHDGWGARLWHCRAPDGLWANGHAFRYRCFAADTARALAAGEPPPPWPSPDAKPADPPTDGSSADPGQPWTATYRVLLDLCDLGAPPDSPVMHETAHLVARNCRWEYDGLPFFAGEVDCCINAGTILIGTYLGVDVDQVVQRLLADQMPDSGWNCWAETRPAPSSFASTLDVIDALRGGSAIPADLEEVRPGRRHGEEYLLRRNLVRSFRTGEVVNPQWALFSYPPRWHYDLLKATEYFARRGGIRIRGWPKRSNTSAQSADLTGDGCSRTRTPARSTSGSGTRRHAQPVEHLAGAAGAALVRRSAHCGSASQASCRQVATSRRRWQLSRSVAKW